MGDGPCTLIHFEAIKGFFKKLYLFFSSPKIKRVSLILYSVISDIVMTTLLKELHGVHQSLTIQSGKTHDQIWRKKR